MSRDFLIGGLKGSSKLLLLSENEGVHLLLVSWKQRQSAQLFCLALKKNCERILSISILFF